MSSVLDLDALITQQALREAITDGEVTTARSRHQLILDYIQQLDEMRRDLRWITDALQYARYKQPRGGVLITCLVDASASESDSGQQKTDSTSSTMDYVATPSPSPEFRRRKAISDSLLGSDEDGSSEVFLPTDSDYDSSDALSPREMDLLYSPATDLSQQVMHTMGGSAPDVLQIHELRYSICPPTDLPTFEGLSLTKEGPVPLRGLANPPAKRKLLSKSHRGQYFSGPQRWLRGQSGESLTGSLSEGVYTKQLDADLTPLGDPASPQSNTYITHASCILESRKARHRELRPHVRRIFVEPCKDESPSREEETVTAAGVSVVVAQAESGEEGEEPDGAAAQELDSDDQTNAQVSEILSSTL
uniref:Uncharacterized protein n=1 Tax=Fundulus heteroclitus TaxID=8078 RepID=A0A3Q2QY99_FUNHE